MSSNFLRWCRILFVAWLPGSVIAADYSAQDIYTESWAPFNYEYEGEIKGIATEMVELLMQRAGLEYQINLEPWARGFNTALNRPNTMIFLTMRTPERESKLQWIGPLFRMKLNLYQLAGRDDLAIDSLEELVNYRVAVLRGGSAEQTLMKMGMQPEHNLIRTSRFSQIMGMFFSNRIDFFVSEDISLRFETRLAGKDISRIRKVMPFSDEKGFYLAVNPDTPPALVSELQEHLDQMISDGTREQIVYRYTGAAPSH